MEPITRLRVGQEVVRMQFNPLSQIYRISPIAHTRNSPQSEPEVARANKTAEVDKQNTPAEYIVEGEILNRPSAEAFTIHAYTSHAEHANKTISSTGPQTQIPTTSLRAIYEYKSNTILGSDPRSNKNSFIDCYV